MDSKNNLLRLAALRVDHAYYTLSPTSRLVRDGWIDAYLKYYLENVVFKEKDSLLKLLNGNNPKVKGLICYTNSDHELRISHDGSDLMVIKGESIETLNILRYHITVYGKMATISPIKEFRIS